MRGVWEGMCPLLEVIISAKANDILHAKHQGMPYEHNVCTSSIKQNFHENGLIVVLFLSRIKTHGGGGGGGGG